MASKKCLDFDYDFFVDISKQIAYKRYAHKKFWNLVLHTVTSSLITWSAMFLLSCFMPAFFMHLNTLCILLLCLKQHTLLGLAACLVYPIFHYHVMYVTTASFLQVCCLLILAYLVQIFVGQKWIEEVEPFSTVPKSNDPNFLALDCYNEVFLGCYHNSVALLIRLDFYPELMDSSNVVLRKIIDRVKKVP